MTFCEVTYHFQSGQNGLSEEQLAALERLKGQLYGMHGFAVDERENLLRVSYDASRLTLKDVEAALRRAGVAVGEAVSPKV
jgi:hypothetical protein